MMSRRDFWVVMLNEIKLKHFGEEAAFNQLLTFDSNLLLKEQRVVAL